MTPTRLTRERLNQIRTDVKRALKNADPAAENFAAEVLDELLAEIDALEAELTKERHDFNMLMLASDVIEKERDEAKAEVKRLHEKYDHQRLVKRVSELEAALGDILSNVALDWYVQQFAKNETPTLSASGIAAKIHNRELYERCAAVFERAHKALQREAKDTGEK